MVQQGRKQPLALPRQPQQPKQVIHRVLGNPEAEMFGGHILDGVRLVEDHMVVAWQQRGAVHPQRQIGEEERVIANQ